MSSKEIKIIEARINEELDNIDSLEIISGHNEIFNNRQLIIFPCLFKIAMQVKIQPFYRFNRITRTPSSSGLFHL